MKMNTRDWQIDFIAKVMKFDAIANLKRFKMLCFRCSSLIAHQVLLFTLKHVDECDVRRKEHNLRFTLIAT